MPKNRTTSEYERARFMNFRRSKGKNALKLREGQTPSDIIQAELKKIGAVPMAIDQSTETLNRQNLIDNPQY